MNSFSYQSTVSLKSITATFRAPSAPISLSTHDQSVIPIAECIPSGIDFSKITPHSTETHRIKNENAKEYLAGKKFGRYRSDLFKKVRAVSEVANIPEIMAQSELIDKILHTDYFDNAGINEFEHIREKLRDLMKYIPVGKVLYETHFDDDILSIEWNESELENDDLKNYKAKMEYYIRQHQDNDVIAKLKTNKPLTADDITALEKILWSEVGSKEDYEAEYGQKPLGELVREIVGMDMNAAKEAFSEYLNDVSLDSRQIYFVNQIVEYIVQNGMMKDLSVLQEPPFTDQGSIIEIFTDLSVWMGIRKAIECVNSNALVA